MIGLVLPGNIWYSPYVNIYTKVLDSLGEDYITISWNRDGRDEKQGIQFDVRANSNGQGVLLPYIKYVRFIKQTIRAQKIDRLIVFGPQLGIFLSHYLKRKFKGRYIFDYRDLSIEQKRFLQIPFKTLLNNAYSIFVSSPGFIKFLPKGYTYHLSHNFNVDEVKKALSDDFSPSLPLPINVLTIGGIRDFTSNVEVMKALANKENMQISFVGKGGASEMLANYAQEHGVKNVSFTGFYQKKDEPSYILKSTFLNIFYPRRNSHDSALANRFYNALIYRRPMIVTANTTHGDYCERYALGLALENCEGLFEKLEQYIAEFDEEFFKQRCNHLLSEFMGDYYNFKTIVKQFVNYRGG